MRRDSYTRQLMRGERSALRLTLAGSALWLASLALVRWFTC